MPETKATKKPAAAKAAAPAAKKTAAPKAAPKAAAPKAAKPKAEKSGKTVTITQLGSPIGRTRNQEATLIGLGLNKRHKVSTLEDTPAVRGMIRAVQHLVRVEENAA